MNREIRKIVVIQTAFLGDLVLTIPLFLAVKKTFPKCWLTVLVAPRASEILEDHSAVDEILVFDKGGKKSGISGIFSIARELKKRSFDLCLIPHESFRSGLLSFISRIPRRVGFQNFLGKVFYTQQVIKNKSFHEVERNLQLLTPLGIKNINNLWPQLEPNSEISARIGKILTNHGIGDKDIIIGIAPGSVWATKRWLPSRFASVADALMDRYNARILLLGSRHDADIGNEIIDSCKRKPINFIGQSLKELVATLSRCHFLITNDNGAMHVATALNLPVLAIFGSTSPKGGFGPYSPDAKIIERNLPCRPCGLHGHRRCPLNHFKCMEELLPEEIISSVESMIQAIR